jgi:hypothetical protein
MKPIIKIILILNLTILAVLVFAYPHLMVSPGKLIEAHKTLETDCFTCHTTFLGASAEKCITCHKVADIGILTTKGMPKLTTKPTINFHQKLTAQDCITCHSDHDGVALYRNKHKFSHALLDTASRTQCNACHQKPKDEKHRQVSDTCSQCHSSEKWKPATFDHKLLEKAELEQCTNCHKAKVPTDKLHQQVSAKCGQCHSTEKWKPARFDHDKWFIFDDEHERCTTCHRIPDTKTPDYKQYTCYFCHEHTPSKIKEKHLKEGIREYENCVACHRSADEDDAKRAWKSLQKGTPYQFSNPVGNVDNKKKKKHDD